jgi:hypothetical protein
MKNAQHKKISLHSVVRKQLATVAVGIGMLVENSLFCISWTRGEDQAGKSGFVIHVSTSIACHNVNAQLGRFSPPQLGLWYIFRNPIG